MRKRLVKPLEPIDFHLFLWVFAGAGLLSLRPMFECQVVEILCQRLDTRLSRWLCLLLVDGLR